MSRYEIRLVTVIAATVFGLAAIETANADVPLTGSFVATQACPAFQSFRKSTNPGNVQTVPNTTYQLLSKNKPDATHYRITIDGAEPEERWVATSCGHLSAEDKSTEGETKPSTIPAPAAPSTAGSATQTPLGSLAKSATHVLAVGWEPTFCENHRDKSECRDMSASSFSAMHLSLHGLWPQPRGTQYCNAPAQAREADEDHDWASLPEPEMSADTLKRLGAVMPGVQSKLQRHEWIVHGTCFGTNADVYFNRAAGLAEAINNSKVSDLFASNIGKNLSADSIRAAFDESFGPGSGTRVTISCHGRGDARKITELVINLAGDVKGSASLANLIQAAPPVQKSCPGGIVDAPQH